MDTQIVAVPTLLLADDSQALLTTLVEMLQVKYRITAALSNGTSVLKQISALRPDVAILDISLGDLTGFDVALRLRDRGCPAKNNLPDSTRRHRIRHCCLRKRGVWICF